MALPKFKQLPPTQYPPAQKPLMVWDGECGFCAYWVSRWNMQTNGKVDFKPYQEAAENFPDIEKQHFKEASRLIDTDGKVYSGPHSAYKSLHYAGKFTILNSWYEKDGLFTRVSDALYYWVVNHRNFMYKLTKALWGSNPAEQRPFWFIYLAFAFYLVYLFLT